MATTLEEKLEALADVFDCDAAALTSETSLESLSWDSMMRVTLIAVARTRFGVKISGQELLGYKTVGDVLRALDR